MGGLASVLAGALLLLWPAWVNGPFPLLFPDSIDYLTNGRDLLLGITRPPAYAWAILPLWRLGGGLPSGLWAVVGAQAALSAWLIRLTLDLVLARPAPAVVTRWMLGLAGPLCALASSLPFLACWILADALTAPTLLAIALLASCWPALRQAERGGLVLLALVGCAAHQTHAAMALAAVAVALILRGLGWMGGRLAWPGIAAAIGAPVLAIVGVLGLNLLVHGNADTAQASPAFLLARLIGDDLVAPHADQLCAERPAMKLCLRRDWLGPDRSVDAFLWQSDSPVWLAYRGVEHVRDDARWLAWNTLRLEWRAALVKGLARAARLLVAYQLPDLDMRPMAEPLMSQLANQLPELVPPEAASAQLSGDLARSWPARIAPWTMLAASLLLPCAIVPLLQRRETLGVLGLLVLTGLVTNALVVGLTAEPYDRYQARLGWLPVLLLAALLAWRFSPAQAAAARSPSRKRRIARSTRSGR